MSTVVKDLGAVSAYAYAVEKGYTGTEAEFAELMADYAEVGQRAEDAAESALNSKTAAQTAATTATNKATEATTAATTATTKAGEASTSASTATSAKDTAVSASQTATSKATEATTAAATATSAKTDAVAANTAAQSAKTAAQTAQTGAETAAASVQSSAEQIATNTDDIAQLKSEKADVSELLKAFPTDSAQGAIASFSDGAELPLKSLMVDIEPVQDLHGQESPYPAGGGKNLLPSIDATFTDSGVTWTLNSDGSVKLEGTATANSVYDFGRNALTLPAGTYITYDQTVSGVYSVTIFKVVNGTASAIKSGGGAFTLTEATSVFVRYVVSSGTTVNTTIYPQLESGSTATAYAPYSNICPISGHTQAVVTRTGVNVWDEEWELGGIANADGAKYTDNARIRSKNYIPVFPSTTYYFKMPSAYLQFKLAFYDANKTFISYTTKKNDTFVTPANCHYIMIAENTTDYGTTYNHDISINYPSTDHDYHPHSGQSINVQLGQTVYGGKLDVVNGVLTVDWGLIDLGVLNWEYDSTYARFACSGFYAFGPYRPADNDTVALMVCDKYATRSDNDTASASYNNIIGLSGTRVLHIKDTSYNDTDAFKASLSGNYLVFKLLEPTTVQLTPNQINSLYGQNNIWADTGDTEVEYRADTKLYIEKLTQPEEDDMIADSAITSGQFFMIGNSLYRALANIASGATITVGTNAQRVSLADALNLVNA